MANRFMTKGRIVLVPFPFDDVTASKVRPAVCLTDPIGRHRHVTLTTTLIRRDMGKLSQAWQDEVDQKLAVLFQLQKR
jgi:hypothetical protein